ncbi:MAG: transglycosylase family protein [Actinomycetota bacterium]
MSSGAQTQGDVEEAQDRLNTSRAELGSTHERLERASAALDRLQVEIQATEADVRVLARRTLKEERSVVGIAEELYMGGSTGVIESVLSADSVAELDKEIKYLESSEDAHARKVEALAVDTLELERRLSDLDEAREEATNLLGDVTALAEELEAEVAQDEAEVADLRDAVAARRAAEAAAEARALASAAQDVVSPPVDVGDTSVNWDAIAACESGGNWALDSTYDGGLQFHPSTWLGYGGGAYARYAWQATREQQIAIAEKVLAAQGPSAWPHCFQYG